MNLNFVLCEGGKKYYKDYIVGADNIFINFDLSYFLIIITHFYAANML